MALISRVVKNLDVPVPYETTTFVFPLKRAQAQDLATTLSAAFAGQTVRTTTSSTQRRTNTRASTATRPNQRRTTTR